MWFAALALLLIPGLDLPLRDWDEGIVARVAYERGQALLQWLSAQASFGDLAAYWEAPISTSPRAAPAHQPALLPWVSGSAVPPAWAVRLVPAIAPVLWCRWLD